MNEITTTTSARSIKPIVDMVTNAVNSEHTRRAYSRALVGPYGERGGRSLAPGFLTWYAATGQTAFTKATVAEHKTFLQDMGVSASSINQRLTAIRKLAVESADNALIGDNTAQAICRVDSIRIEGRKLGNWLDKDKAQELLQAPMNNKNIRKGIRDRALLAVLLGCGLRREEVVSLTVEHTQQRDARWVIVDLVGKRNKVRSVPMPTWCKQALDEWCAESGIRSGVIFRPVRLGGRIMDGPITPQAVWNTVTEYAERVGVTVAPHDLRRTFAKLARNGGAELDQIQLSLGHASVQTTQHYVGDFQDLNNAPCDAIKLSL